MLRAEESTTGIVKSRYMPGLDGLRALSVLAVIAYHLNISWAPGGLLGVGIFFTLSGYLITDQLLAQWQCKQRIDLQDFWLRRIRRLLPAMAFMLSVVGVWLLVFDRARLISLQGDFISSLLYFNNWWLIFHDVSYFESFGPPSPIGHLWSLAIEEQFYLLWPLILAIGLHFMRRRSHLILFILLGAAASALAMAIMYVPGTDPSRVYYGTDTRAFALLIGAALAVVWPSRRLSGNVAVRSRWLLDCIGGAGLIGIVWLIWSTNEYEQGLYHGGLALFAILSAFVTAILAHPASFLAKIMAAKPLRWIGVRSYSLYLWHFPVIILTSPTVDTDGFDGSRAVLQLMLTFILAAISWKFVEEPIRRGSWASVWKKFLSRGLFKTPHVLSLSLLCSILFLTSCFGGLQAEKPSIPSPPTADVSSKAAEKNPEPSATPNHPPADIPDHQTTADEKAPAANPAPLDTEFDRGITAIGDSVILDAKPHLEKLLPGIVVDGKVGRQMSQAQDVVDRLRSEGKLGDYIIIELGTNGAFTQKQLRELLASLEDAKQILLVNTRVPRQWQDTVNSTLEEIAAEFPTASIVDWYTASKGKDSFFTEDGVHLKQEGAKFYASLLSEAVQLEG